jgi:hypothetical protein
MHSPETTLRHTVNICSSVGAPRYQIEVANLVVVRTAKCNLCPMRDLEEMAEKLLESARKLPPGPERHEFLKELGLLRSRIAAFIARQEQLQSAK